MTTSNGSLEMVLDARARLGECPLWDAKNQLLYWVDIYGHRVHQFNPATGADRFFDVEEVVGPLALTGDQRILMAQRSRLAFLDTQNGAIEVICSLEADKPDNRFNDGKCDSQGRFWFGSMSEVEEPEASLYRYDPDGSLHVMETGLTISNGLGWSPDDKTFYLTDSPPQKIYAYDYDAESGEIANCRVFVDLKGEEFFPDGLCVDTEGCVWSSMWDGWQVIRFDPDGKEMMRVKVPVQLTTCCIFGGADLRDLYITTASVGLSQKEIQESFQAGNLFRFRADVAGLPSHPFGQA